MEQTVKAQIVVKVDPQTKEREVYLEMISDPNKDGKSLHRRSAVPLPLGKGGEDGSGDVKKKER